MNKELQKVLDQYLLDGKYHGEALEAFTQKHENAKDREDELIALEMSFVDGEVSAQEVGDLLQQAFGLSEEETKEFHKDFLGLFWLPIQKIIPAAQKVFNELGGNPNDYLDYRVERPEMSPAGIVKDFMQNKGVNLESDVLEKRLELILSQYVEKKRNEEQTVVMLQRESSIGGLGLSEKIAVEIVKELKDSLQEFEAIENIEVENEPVVKKEEKATEEKELAPEPKPKAEIRLHPRRVALKPQEKISQATIQEDNSLHIHDVASEVDRMQEIKGLPPLDSITNPSSGAQKKERMLTPQMTKELAASVPVVSGDIVSDEEKREIELHKKKVDRAVVEDRPPGKEAEEILEKIWEEFKQKNIKKRTLGQVIESGLRETRTLTQIEKTLQEVHGLGRKEAEHISGMIALQKNKRIVQVVKEQEKRQKKEHLAQQKSEAEAAKKALNELIKKNEALGIREEKVEIKQAKVEVSIPTVSPPAQNESAQVQRPKQKVEDVVRPVRVLGPIDEIASMELRDFRLLSSRAQDIPDVIESKVATIAKNGFEDGLQAKEAWRRSPVNRTYVELLKQAMREGKSMPDVIAENREKGMEVPSPAEIRAIMDINKRLGQ